MCGRYALSLRPSQIRPILEDDGMPVSDLPEDEGNGAPRQSYNFAPGYVGVVYRAETAGFGVSAHQSSDNNDSTLSTDDAIQYKLQSMTWGLIPFWTKRNPDYSGMLKTINCRDDSLSTPGGMWSTMKARKRCIVIMQGFFEWQMTGPKDKLPHYVKRQDGKLMYLAGLWDCVQYEDSDVKHYTYTIITTDSSKQLKFLHDRMPVILDPGSDDMWNWLDPKKREWSRDLQDILKPFNGPLEVYPVSKDVGKVGNNSPSFIVSRDSKDNKYNIANFFTNAAATGTQNKDSRVGESKRKRDGSIEDVGISQTQPDSKRQNAGSPSPRKGIISSVKNEVRLAKPKQSPGGKGTQKITTFFQK